MNISQYIDNLNKRYQTGISREHAYRGDLQQLLESILKDVQVINEPARIACGAPDYIITRKDIPLGYVEAKDICIDLNSKSLKEQFDRYKASLNNLIITDYLEFRFYKDGELTTSIKIAEIIDTNLIPIPDNFKQLENLLLDFASNISQTIKSPTKLAEMMAGKAKLLAAVIEKAVTSDDQNQANSQLKDQFKAFKDVLLSEITHKGFADMYAQTIAYGLFAARYHDPTLDTFSRHEAAQLIPHSNPFLRKLFQTIAGYDLDERIVWIVDDLVQIFLAANVANIMKNFGRKTKQEDPIIHFYETFLAAYDKTLRKSRGVWYTPEPVVNFIVRAVDDILKDEFGLPQGLADTSKTKIKVNTDITDNRSATGYKQVEQEVHKVQVLDPATGTGTFLAEVVKHIHKKFEKQAGIWPGYVEKDLIPRLNGFELLMTSYAMAHLKMDMLFTETGFTNPNKNRFRIYLTNSLEEAHENQMNLFTQWLSQEANEANNVKRDTPVMCVIGNPPYAVSSTNKNEWIQNLISDYKKNLNERKINLDDDYIKFIRYGQHYIDKNGSGVLAYITNNSFIDGITHRQMRKSLVSTFDTIYIIDLHGNSSKKEKHPDGSPDENVFDIQQGVSINIFIKSQKSNKSIKHFDLYGKRIYKYQFLNENNLSTIGWNDLITDSENCFFTNKDFALDQEYMDFLSLSELFILSNSGIQTKCDSISISEDVNQLKKTVSLFQNESIEELKYIFKRKESSGWNYENAKADLLNNSNLVYAKYNYRPFDFRKVVYTGNSSGFIGRSRSIVMKHFINKSNIGICLMRQFFQDAPYSHIYATNSLIDERTMYSNRGGTYLFPLYRYKDTNGQKSTDSEEKRVPNFNQLIVKQISEKLGLTYTSEKVPTTNTFAPIDILDYIYAVLHSPTYREKYIEFLKIDFPRVPYPTDADKFWKLVALGKQIREIHLLESPKVEEFITGYPEDGDNIIRRKITKTSPGFELDNEETKTGKVWINDTQYFSDVPEVAWNFYIGGYQPAQKWLKDRSDRELSYDDILHYQKIIVALTETDRLMKEIDKVGVI